MALDFQNVPIPLAQGVDEKSDPKQLAIGSLTVLQNASFQSPKQIKKRDGYVAKPLTVSGGSPIAKGLGVQAYKNELLEMDGRNLFSYSSTLASWVNKGSLALTSLTSMPVVRNTTSQSNQDVAYDQTSGLYCYTWTDSIQGVQYSIYDSISGNFIVSQTQVGSANDTIAKVLNFSSNFVIIYYDSSAHTLNYKKIPISNPTSISTQTVVATDINTTSPVFDAEVIGFFIFIAYSRTSSVAVYTLSTTFFASAQYIQSGSSAANGCISVISDANTNAWISYGNVGGTTSYYYFILNPILTQVLGNTALATSQVMNFHAITGHVSGATGPATFYFHHDDDSFSIVSGAIFSNTATLTGTVGTPKAFGFNAGLASKAFLTPAGDTCFLAVYPGPQEYDLGLGAGQLPSIENTYFLMNGSGSVLAKIAPGNSGNIPTTGMLPEVALISGSNYTIAHLYKDDLSSTNGNIFYNLGVQSTTVNLAISSAPSKLNMANLLHIAGGQLQMYDGVNICEHGFHLYPENLATLYHTSGGGIGKGTSTASINQIQYVAVYEWADNYGQIHRSSPSPVATVQLPATTAITFTGNITAGSKTISSASSVAGLVVGQVISDTTTPANIPAGTTIVSISGSSIVLSNQATATASGNTFSTSDVSSITVTIPTLLFTAKSNVSIVLYRTPVNQTVFYRTSSLTSLTYNDKTKSVITILDTTSDAVLIGNEQLYTTGGVVENIGAPACSILFQYKNRPILVPSETQTEFWYGQEVVPGSPTEFSDLFTQNIDNRIGQITAGGVMDDKMIWFGPSGPNAKFYVAGDGPSPSGANNDFTNATKITGVTGCQNQGSVLETPYGLLYQDKSKGIWLLDRSMQEQYVGADVSQFISQTITSGQIFETSNKALFTLASGQNIVFDYFVNQWEIDVFPQGGIDSTIFQEKFTYVQSDGTVQVQDSTTFTDNGASIPSSMKTGWLNFAGVEGFQRVIEFQIMGTYKSPHTLTVNFYTDFGTTASQTVVIPVLTDPGLYQYRITVKVQKCTSLQVEILETQSSPFGQGFWLSSLAFRVGVKKGLFKLPAAASY